MSSALRQSYVTCRQYVQQPGWQVSILQLLLRRYAIAAEDVEEAAFALFPEATWLADAVVDFLCVIIASVIRTTAQVQIVLETTLAFVDRFLGTPVVAETPDSRSPQSASPVPADTFPTFLSFGTEEEGFHTPTTQRRWVG